MKKEPITDKNSEGYADKTASSAMKAADKTQQGFKDGDIVTIDTNGKDVEVVLFRCFDSYAVNTGLMKFRPDQNSYMLNIGGAVRFVDAGHLFTIPYDRIWDRVGSLTEEQLKGMRREVARAFRIAEENQEKEEPEPERIDAREVMETLTEIRQTIASKCDDGEIAALRVELNSKQKAVINEMQGRIKAEAQRDIWKSLYEQERSNEA